MNDSIVPLVSISCLVFNHGPYIRQCLDGFVMQRTDFPFEVLIHDDASTDGSSEIIREYEQQYPDIIKPIYESYNQWVKGRRGSAVFNFPRAQGKYISLCEGDDFWTDPLKLQKQVDFLEANPGCSMCFHNAENLFDDGTMSPFSFVENRNYYPSEIFDGWIIPTASVVFKKEVVDSDFYKKDVLGAHLMFGDTPLFLSCAKFGSVHGMADTMSVYRRQNGGISRNFNKSTYKDLMEYHRSMGSLFGLEKLSSKVMARGAVDGFCYSLKSKEEKTDFGLLIKALSFNFPYSMKLLVKRLMNFA